MSTAAVVIGSLRVKYSSVVGIVLLVAGQIISFFRYYLYAGVVFLDFTMN